MENETIQTSEEKHTDSKETNGALEDNGAKSKLASTEKEFIRVINRLLCKKRLAYWGMRFIRDVQKVIQKVIRIVTRKDITTLILKLEEPDKNLKKLKIELENPFQTIQNEIQKYGDKKNFIRALKADCQKGIKTSSMWAGAISFISLIVTLIKLEIAVTTNPIIIWKITLIDIFTFLTICVFGGLSFFFIKNIKKLIFILEVIEAYEQDQKNKIQESQKEA